MYEDSYNDYNPNRPQVILVRPWTVRDVIINLTMVHVMSIGEREEFLRRNADLKLDQ